VEETSVIVAASAEHRAEAFEAARRLIDRIKEILPVWKREHFDDGTAEWAPGFAVPAAARAAAPAPAGARAASGRDPAPDPAAEAGRRC
jgi:hypothetical protein